MKLLPDHSYCPIRKETAFYQRGSGIQSTPQAIALYFYASTMTSRDPHPPGFTTNEEDQREAQKLKDRLDQQRETASSVGGSASNSLPKVQACQIDEGAHKYVLIQARRQAGDAEYFVISQMGAAYHRNAAEPLIYELERAGYDDIRVKGGGRIDRNDMSKEISIYGFSYSFGQPDHNISRSVVLNDARFHNYTVTTSNEGY